MTESPDEVCADWEEDEPDETWKTPSACSLDGDGLAADESESPVGADADRSMMLGATEAAQRCAAQSLRKCRCGRLCENAVYDKAKCFVSDSTIKESCQGCELG